MFHYIDPIIRRKVGGLVTLSVASYKYFVWNNIQINMVYHSLLKGFYTFSELKTLIEIFLKILSSLKHFPNIFWLSLQIATKSSVLLLLLLTESVFIIHEVFQWKLIIELWVPDLRFENFWTYSHPNTTPAR